ncbi:glycoside hydrolase family 1 protein [Phellopilus nigrolimitatus]|nr:glycoside hydrolase family 1 protein [Phellopilus nigrolimitatus]
MAALRALWLAPLVLLTVRAASNQSASSGFSSLSATLTTVVASSSSFTPSTITPAPSSTVAISGSSTAAQTSTTASFVAIGSIPRNFSDVELELLWALVGPVEEPPFTTTPVPDVPVTLPTAPPPLYPTWYALQPKNIFPNLTFPSGFKFGVATSAYQVEGAAKSDGKGPTGWDWGARQIGQSGDIADLQYFLYKNDTASTAALGVNAQSFSISWARIFPFGTKDSPVNQPGLDHYSDRGCYLSDLVVEILIPFFVELAVINYSLSLGVEPVVTLFHWDLPLALSAYYGGFTSPDIVDDYVHYAETVFKAYNGSVKMWYTFNEPYVYCEQLAVYPFDLTLAPGVNSSTAPFLCAYYLLKAHAGAVKAFRAMNITGEIAFKNNGYVGKPWRTNTTEDTEAVERNAAFGIGAFSEAVYGSGDWPDIMKETLPESILPRFTEEEQKDLKGSADFFAIDAYSSLWVAAPPNGIASCLANPSDPYFPFCFVQVDYDSSTNWPAGVTGSGEQASWLKATPNNLRHELSAIKKRWPYNKIYISEFGFAEPEEQSRTNLAWVLDDADRTNYYMTMLGEALLAIHEDGIPLAGTFAWGMIDDLEWQVGQESRFGIQYVNYTTFERSYKRSAMALSEFFSSHT